MPVSSRLQQVTEQQPNPFQGIPKNQNVYLVQQYKLLHQSQTPGSLDDQRRLTPHIQEKRNIDPIQIFPKRDRVSYPNFQHYVVCSQRNYRKKDKWVPQADEGEEYSPDQEEINNSMGPQAKATTCLHLACNPSTKTTPLGSRVGCTTTFSEKNTLLRGINPLVYVKCTRAVAINADMINSQLSAISRQSPPLRANRPKGHPTVRKHKNQPLSIHNPTNNFMKIGFPIPITVTHRKSRKPHRDAVGTH
uniref:Uncharacterized protein n=1 Tax=Ananas comosus var. bracteatus TaxID=296719 RepID=A0A6V7QN74_ANACO|nr:unnamed protein product [Ananas comosus var. bracteatus]